MKKNIMRTSAIVLENSQLIQNVVMAILAPSYRVDCTKHLADIDILLNEDEYDAIVVGESVFNKEAWNGLIARNPNLKNIQRVYISSHDLEPDGFELLKRPFAPIELLDLLDVNFLEDCVGSVASQSVLEGFNNKRLYQRVPLRSEVFLNDEYGKPIIRLAARDISLGGMFVEGEIPLQVGSLAFLSFKYEGSDVSVTGQVARIGVRGVGVRFLGVSPEMLKTLNT